jgi:hypothetical protein
VRRSNDGIKRVPVVVAIRMDLQIRCRPRCSFKTAMAPSAANVAERSKGKEKEKEKEEKKTRAAGTRTAAAAVILMMLTTMTRTTRVPVVGTI